MASDVDFSVLLGLAYQSFVDELRTDLQARGYDDLGGAYGYVFRALQEDSLYLRQLAERLGMTVQGAAKIVNAMELGGYLERCPDPEDGRIKKLRLARRGRAALAAARKFHANYERRIAAVLGQKDAATLRRALTSLIAGDGADAAHARLRPL